MLGCTNLFCLTNYEKNDKIISEKVLLTKKTKRLYCVICGKYRKFEKSKLSYLLEKALVLSVICSNNKKIFKLEKPIEIFKILGLFENI